MENLQLTQKYKEPIQEIAHFTDNDLIQLLVYGDLEQYTKIYYHDDIKDTLNDLANHYNMQNNMYINLILAINDVKFTHVSLSEYTPASNEYKILKNKLDSITFKRPKMIPITKQNEEDTITLIQLWNYIKNKTNYIKSYYINNIRGFIDTKKNDEYYFNILDNISSLYNDLYSFLNAAGKYVNECAEEKQYNEYIDALQNQFTNNISKLEYIKQNMICWVNYHKDLISFKLKCQNDFNKYLSDEDQDFDPELIDDIIIDLYKTIFDNTSEPFKQYSTQEYYTDAKKACFDIFHCFQAVYGSLTSMLRQCDTQSLLNNYGDDESIDNFKLNNIKYSKNDLKYLNKDEYKDLFKLFKKEDKENNEENKENKITCSQLLQYFVNNISRKLVQTIQNITMDVINNMPKNYSELYDILNSHINNFVNKIDLITYPLFNFLTNELNNNEEVKSNVVIKHVLGNLSLFPEKCTRIVKLKNKIRYNIY